MQAWHPLEKASGRWGSKLSRTSRPSSGTTSETRTLLEGPTEPVRGHVRRHRLVALALRRRTHIKECGAVLLNPDSSRLAAPEPRGFDATCNPHPDESPIAQARNLAQLFEGEREQARIVAAVVDEPAPAARITGRERDLLRLGQNE